MSNIFISPFPILQGKGKDSFYHYILAKKNEDMGDIDGISVNFSEIV